MSSSPADTDRQRGGVTFTEKWTNARAALIGFMTGRGYSSAAIQEKLSDVKDPATIRHMWKLWGLSSENDVEGSSTITIPISRRDRAYIYQRAQQHGISMEEYCSQMLIAGAMPRDRFLELTGEAKSEQ